MLIRKFSPGSDWLYIKIYSGVKTSDFILQKITGSIRKQLKENLTIKWFFIRYVDPKHHLRLRLQLADVSKFEIVLQQLNISLQEFINSGEIANIVIDSYTREIQRYGETTVEYAEDLFFKSSDLVVSFLEFNDEKKIMVSMFYFENILASIKLSELEKLKWISNFDKLFKEEFNGDKHLNSQLDKKFRIFKPKYIEFANSTEFTEIRNLILSKISVNVHDLESLFEYKGQEFSDVLPDFFQSFFHMHLNRMFCSNQRLYELVVYDFLKRHFKTSVCDTSVQFKLL